MTLPQVRAITLARLNGLGPSDADRFFRSICGSKRWAAGMAGCLPFWDIRVLHNASRAIWQQLGDDDRREALRERPPAATGADEEALEMEHYRMKFGFNYLVDPEQPSGSRGLLRDRLEGDAASELAYASAIEETIVESLLSRSITP